MHDHPDNPDDPKNGRSDQSPDDERGYLVQKLKVGDILMVGDSAIHVNEIAFRQVKVAIKAKRDVKVRRLP